MSATEATDAATLHRDALVIDTHTHPVGFIPQPFRAAYRLGNRLYNRHTFPPDEPFDHLTAAGVDVVVAKAVGDPVVTRWYRGGAWRAVERQLELVVAQMRGQIVTTAAQVRTAHGSGRPVAILGVEGGDALGRDVDNVARWHGRGVRVVTLVHLADNQFGTTCMPWQKFVGPLPVRRKVDEGLSPLGAQVVDRMQQVGILIDLAHADQATLLAVVERATRPVAATHSGARARQAFDRFLTDDEIRAVAGTAGVIGLWPYCNRGRGVMDLADLVGHARYVADLVGPEHLCVGTDMNGVPGLMAGYRGETDLPLVTAGLLDGGFSPDEVRGILGENALRVLAAACG
jgi:membrane dipeptidase